MLFHMGMMAILFSNYLIARNLLNPGLKFQKGDPNNQEPTEINLAKCFIASAVISIVVILLAIYTVWNYIMTPDLSIMATIWCLIDIFFAVTTTLFCVGCGLHFNRIIKTYDAFDIQVTNCKQAITDINLVIDAI